MSTSSFFDKSKILPAIYWLFLMACLAPWFYLRIQQATHSDMLWLGEAAIRLLDGKSMSTAAYDPNPPLSILLYIIPALLQKYALLPLHIGVQIQAFFILIVSTIALIRSLKYFPDVNVFAGRIIISGYLLLNTIGAGLVFGERDHLIGMILPPLIMLQLSLTSGSLKSSCWVWLFFVMAALLILLKPPYGLLPALILLHRAWCRRSLNVLKDPDFVSLAVMTAGYMAAIWLFFRDYLDIILPDMLRYYYPSASDKNLLLNTAYLAATGLGAIFVACPSKIPAGSKRVIIFLCLASLIAIIPIIIQMKGFYYHYLPALGLLAMALLLLAYEWLFHETRHVAGSIVTTLAIASVTAFTAAPLDFNYPRHGTYKTFPLPSLIVQENNNQSVYIFNDSMSLSHEIPYYTGMAYASRFPSLWFLPGLYHARAINTPDWEEKRDQYALMMAEDLNTYKPGLVLFLEPGAFDQKIDPLEFFANTPAFRRAWSHYTYVQSTTVDEGVYFGNAVRTKLPREFRIYRRTSDM